MKNFGFKNSLLILLISLSGCAGISFDRTGAKSLSSAGQAATEELQKQADQTSQSLKSLQTTSGVTEILNCHGVKDASIRKQCISGAEAKNQAFDEAQQKLLEIIDKREMALSELSKAYVSFGKLATYDAAQETTTSVETAFNSINNLTTSLNAVLSANLVIAPITATIGKVLGGVGAAFAEKRQAELVMATNKDLEIAVNALILALSLERDLAGMKSLMMELQSEKSRLEAASFSAGLAFPINVLKTFYADELPEMEIEASPSDVNADLYVHSANYILKESKALREKQVAQAYDHSIASLSAVSAEHKKYELQKEIDVSGVITEISHIVKHTQPIGKK